MTVSGSFTAVGVSATANLTNAITTQATANKTAIMACPFRSNTSALTDGGTATFLNGASF